MKGINNESVNDYYIGDIPEIFRIADTAVAMERKEREGSTMSEKTNKEKDPEKKKTKKDKSLKVDVEAAKKASNEESKKMKKKKKKHKEVRIKTRQEYESEMIQLMARADFIRHRLEELDPYKSKDSIKIGQLNVELKMINDTISIIEKESGIKRTEIETGSKFGRIVASIKKFFKRRVKKIKKFFKKNDELIMGIAAISIPVIMSVLIRSIVLPTPAAAAAA